MDIGWRSRPDHGLRISCAQGAGAYDHLVDAAGEFWMFGHGIKEITISVCVPATIQPPRANQFFAEIAKIQFIILKMPIKICKASIYLFSISLLAILIPLTLAPIA